MIRRREFIAGFGSAAAWPLVARAQQQAFPRIGVLSQGLRSADDFTRAPFLRGLAERGYVEAQNVEIFYHYAEGQRALFPALAQDLVRLRVNVIVAFGAANIAVPAAKAATATIPIVFGAANDPVALGLVASFNQPGGNATGVFFLTGALVQKRLELLHEIVPAVTSIGFLRDPMGGTAARQVKEAEAAARILGVRLTTFNVTTAGDIESAFAGLASRGIGAVLTGSNAFYVNVRRQFAMLAAGHGVPAIYPSREFVEAGGLMSYGPSAADAARLIGTYAGRILNGEKPADLPVQQTTKVELVLLSQKAAGDPN
jgi:putative tryptophan/tyrosine transport system substrate-binding protein